MVQVKWIRQFFTMIACIGGMSLSASAQNWNPNHSVGTINAVYNFTYNQTPSQLVEIYPAANPNTGLAYQWESSLSPLSGFTAITSGGTLSSYSFSVPVTQTTYFRRKTMDPSHGWVF